jgi:glycosyltransferase involved in cell wall biosynthesis
VTSIVIPAHNEGAVVGRLLKQLISGANPDEFDVFVIANGCTDDTAEQAASVGPGVRVLSIPVASKRAALDAGDLAAQSSFPRIYVDADVELGSSDVRALRDALGRPGVLAAAPQRELVLADRPLLVRCYYDVWTRLPVVRNGLFGRGVVAVNAAGHDRIRELPPAMGDDLAVSLEFQPAERAIVEEARVLVHPPRTTADLVRRRVRAAVSVAQLEDGSHGDASARTQAADLVQIVRADKRMLPRVAIFLGITVVARLRARRAIRRRDFSTWLRDESSRQ